MKSLNTVSVTFGRNLMRTRSYQTSYGSKHSIDGLVPNSWIGVFLVVEHPFRASSDGIILE